MNYAHEHDYAHEHEPWDGRYECPVCHNDDNLCIDDSGEYDDYYYYEMYCEDCGAVFRQWYRMVPSEVDYSTKEEQEQYRPAPSIPSMPAPQVASVPPSELPHVELRHNYDLAPVSDNPLLDVVSQAQADSAQEWQTIRFNTTDATRDLLLGRVDWEAVARSLQEE